MRMNKHLNNCMYKMHTVGMCIGFATCYQFQTNHIIRNTDYASLCLFIFFSTILNWNAFNRDAARLQKNLHFFSTTATFSILLVFSPLRYDSIEF